MKFKKGVTLKFKVTFLVLTILICVCAMLTYTSIYKNKGTTNLAIKKLENSTNKIEKAIETNDVIIYNNLEDLEISSESVSSVTLYDGDNSYSSTEDIQENNIDGIGQDSDISSNTLVYNRTLEENNLNSLNNDTQIASEIIPAAKYIRLQMEPIQATLVSSQANFRNMQITFMIIMVILGSIITYIILSKFLNPLTKMTNIIENINHNNLDEEIKLPKSNDEIYRLSKSFNDMLGRIKNSFEMEKNFSASASHELKTPLAIMKSSIQVLKLSDKPTIEEYEENIEIIEENIEKLIDIVNNLLLLTSNNIGLVEKVNIKEILDKIILNFNNDLKNKNITVNNNIDDCIINSNKSLINCVFENIISNAIKYNKYNGEINITLEKQENKFKFIIEDTGIGISQNNINNIFEPFFREDTSRSKKIKGNGLGLALVKNILEKINGNILVESEKQKGTKVILTI